MNNPQCCSKQVGTGKGRFGGDLSPTAVVATVADFSAVPLGTGLNFAVAHDAPVR
jgi:hypothetical protein